MGTTRHPLLAAFLAVPFVQLNSAVGQEVPALPLTRACDDGDEPTLEREAGPLFKSNAPLKRDLFPESPGGERLTVAGLVALVTSISGSSFLAGEC